MKRQMTRLGLIGLAITAIFAIGMSPAAAKKKKKKKPRTVEVTKTATVNQCLSTSVAIPDSSDGTGAAPTGSAAVSTFIDVPTLRGGPQDGAVTAFRSVDVRISHTMDGDLILHLVSPGGKVVTLAAERGGGGDGYGSGAASCAGSRVFFGDAFGGSILTPGNVGDGPILGSFRPESGLMSSFVGGPARGYWTLIVSDEAPGDVGTVDAFSLDFTYSYRELMTLPPKKKKKKKKKK